MIGAFVPQGVVRHHESAGCGPGALFAMALTKR